MNSFLCLGVYYHSAITSFAADGDNLLAKRIVPLGYYYICQHKNACESCSIIGMVPFLTGVRAGPDVKVVLQADSMDGTYMHALTTNMSLFID